MFCYGFCNGFSHVCTYMNIQSHDSLFPNKACSLLIIYANVCIACVCVCRLACELQFHTSMSLLRATSSKFSCCSSVLSTLSSVMQKQRMLNSMWSIILANTTNLAKYGTQISSRYSWDAKPTVSLICWQSANQNLQKGQKRKTFI